MSHSTNVRETLINIGIVIISLVISFLIISKLLEMVHKNDIIPYGHRSFAGDMLLYYPIVTLLVFATLRKAIDYTFFNEKKTEGNVSYAILLLALLSFIYSWVGIIPFFSILGILMGNKALKVMKASSNMRGSSLAIIGITFSYLWLLLYVFIIVRFLYCSFSLELNR